MAAAGRPGLAKDVRQADVGEKAGEHVGVASCGCGVAVGVEVEREKPEPLIRCSKVDRPRSLRSSRADRAIAVLVRDRTVRVDDGDAYAGARADCERYCP